ncbi:hypothetical protein VPH35_010614 [Triticum aestivum]
MAGFISSPSDDSDETLPDDVVVEILVRVTDVAALFRCAATCKRCGLLVAEPSFLCRRWPEGVSRPSSLLGFFSGALRLRPSRPTPRRHGPSPLGQGNRFPNFPGPRGTQAGLLTSRRGLLVGRRVRLDEPGNGHMKTMILELCDPIAGKSHRLPALKSNRHFRIEGCALLTGADCCPAKRREAPAAFHSSFFKVLIIAADRDEPRHSLHVFTSTESGSSWSTPRECLDTLELEHGTRLVSQKTSAIVCQGVAHWLFKNTSNLYALSVCGKTTEMSLTRLPVKPDQTPPILGVTDDGAPSLLRLDGQCTMLEIWTRRSDNMSGVSNTDRWHRTKMIELQPPEWGKMDQLQCLCAGETSGILLIKDNQEDMYIVDLQTGAMEAVTNWFRGIVMMAIPFEMDWPAFFTRHLANTRVKRSNPRGALSKIGGVLSKIADLLGDQ